MLSNAYFLAKFRFDTAENEQHFAEILRIGRRVADGGREASLDTAGTRAGPREFAQKNGQWEVDEKEKPPRGSRRRIATLKRFGSHDRT